MDVLQDEELDSTGIRREEVQQSELYGIAAASNPVQSTMDLLGMEEESATAYSEVPVGPGKKATVPL